MLEDVEIRHQNYENRMIPNDLVDCLAASLLNTEVSDFILFSKKCYPSDVSLMVSQDIQISRTLLPRLDHRTVLHFLRIPINIHPCYITLPVKKRRSL